MLGGSERESGRAPGRSLIIECTIAIEPSADFDSPKMPNHAPSVVRYEAGRTMEGSLQRTPDNKLGIANGASRGQTEQQTKCTAQRMLGRFCRRAKGTMAGEGPQLIQVGSGRVEADERFGFP